VSTPGVQRITRGTGTKVVPALADYDAVSPGWSEAEYRARLADTASVAGFWEGEPGSVAFDSWPYNEVCVILSGRVAVEAEDGEYLEFSAGEAFTVPAGFRGVWHTLERTEKIFVGVVTDSEVRALRSTEPDT
jgi:uncharacterized cupin superfamily protein